MSNPIQESFEERVKRLKLQAQAQPETMEQRAGRLNLPGKDVFPRAAADVTRVVPSTRTSLITEPDVAHFGILALPLRFYDMLNKTLAEVPIPDGQGGIIQTVRYKQLSPYAQRYLEESARLARLPQIQQPPNVIEATPLMQRFALTRGITGAARAVGHIATHPLESITDLFVTQPFMLSYKGGLVLTPEGRQYGGINTPEQEEEARRGLSALLVSLPAAEFGAAAGGGLARGLGTSELASRIIAGQTAGAFGGTTFGIAEAPQGERFDRATMYGLLAVPLGLLFEATGRLSETPVEPIERRVSQKPSEQMRRSTDVRVGDLTGQVRTPFEVTGSRATPKVPTEPTLLEMQQGLKIKDMSPDISDGGERASVLSQARQVMPQATLDPSGVVGRIMPEKAVAISTPADMLTQELPEGGSPIIETIMAASEPLTVEAENPLQAQLRMIRERNDATRGLDPKRLEETLARTGREALAEQARAAQTFVQTGDLVTSIIRSRNALDPKSIVVVPRASNPAEALKQAGPETITAVHSNKDGTFDVAIGGKESWLHGAANRKQFRSEGFIARQLVEYNGKPYAYVREGILRDIHNNELVKVEQTQIRRPIYNRLISPEITTETGKQAFRAGNVSQNAINQLVYKDFKELTHFNLDTEKLPPFNENIRTFFDTRNIPESERGTYQSAIESELAKEARRLLDDDTRAAYDRVSKEIKTLPTNLETSAGSNGMFVDRLPGGEIVVRDHDFETPLLRTSQKNAEQEAQEFIDKSGQRDGINLDGGGDNPIPPRIVGGAMPPSPPPIRPNEIPQEFPKLNFTDRMLALIENWTKIFTPVEPRYLSLDKLKNTQFWSRVIYPTQRAAIIKNNLVHPYLKRIQTEIDALARKGNLTPTQLEQVFDYIETISPQEIRDGVLLKGRPLTNTELNLGQMFAEDKIDIQRVFDFLREKVRLERKFTGEAARNEAIDELVRNMSMDEKHLNAAVLLESVKKASPDIATAYTVTRYARSLMANGGKGEYTRAEFVKANSLTPIQIELAKRVEGMFDELTAVFGIHDYRVINRFVNHYPVVKGSSIQDAFLWDKQVSGKFGVRELEFISEMMRSGELNVYERNPVRALVRYVNAGFSKKSGFNTSVKNAWDAATQEIKKFDDSGAQEAVLVDVRRYLTELQGRPLPSDKLAQNVLESFTKSIGVETSLDARRNFVNTILSLTHGGAQAFRPALGARDAAQMLATYYTRFGTIRTGRMMELMRDKVAIQQLRDEGKLLSQSPIQFSSPTEMLATSVGRGLTKTSEFVRKLSEIGFEVTLQRQIHEVASGGAYLEVMERAVGRETGVIPKVVRGEMTKAQAYKKLFLGSYDRPIQIEFDRLVTAGKALEAAEMLALKTARDVTVPYGMANHPAGWGTNTGRLLGQFGLWSTWQKSMVPRWFTQGSIPERLGVMARFGITQGALALTQQATGFNMFSWYLIPGLFFTGGPVLGGFNALANALGGYSPYKRAQGRKELARLATLPIIGSKAIADWAEALDLLNQGHNPAQVAGTALGMPPARGRFWIDDVFGTYPQPGR